MFYNELIYSLKVFGIQNIPKLPDDFVLNPDNHNTHTSAHYSFACSQSACGEKMCVCVFILLFPKRKIR